ncbi:MAG: aquaporin [Acidobacteria bacterium]|nr:aquaporin [Acidobacteriota bacterium]
MHKTEYLMEAALLGLFMMSACAFGVLLEHGGSPVRQAIENDFVRRVLMGLAMGCTSLLLVLSPMGKRSGAHFNPAVTLAFLRLGKITGKDAAGYIAGQFVGGVTGVALSWAVLSRALADPSVNFVATVPGAQGAWVAFVAEVVISFGMMTMVLQTSNRRRLARFTPLLAGVLLATYITVEAPVSGTSMNPARTFGSAVPAGLWSLLWIYFLAPPVGMLVAAEVYARTRGLHQVFCAKLHHANAARCIFRCNYGQLAAIAMLVVMMASTGRAQSRHELGLMLGSALPASRTLTASGQVDFASGMTLLANYGVRLTGGKAAAIYFEVPFLATPQHSLTSSQRTITRDIATLYLTPGIRVKLAPGARVSPYVAAGGGYALFEQSRELLSGGTSSVARHKSSGAFDFGGGVDVRFWRFVSLRGEVRDYVSGNPLFGLPVSGSAQHNVVVAGGIVLNFGKK